MPTLPVRYPDADRLRERESTGHDRTAQGYSDSGRERGAPFRALLIEHAGIVAGQRILDLCSGPGWLTIDAARVVGSEGHVTGVDLSDAMIAVAQTNASESGLQQLDFRQGDVEELPFDDASFDRVLISAGLMHVPDPSRALGEVVRVLVPGGRLVANVWGPDGETIVSLFADALESAGEPLSLDYRYLVRLGDAQLLEDLASDAGFAQATAAQVKSSITVPDAGEQWDNFIHVGGLFSGLLAELSEEGKARARSTFIEICEPGRTDEGVVIPVSQFILVAER